MSFGLTPRQDQLVKFIRQYAADHGGISPSYEQMATALGLHSKNSISELLNQLETRGAITRKRGSNRSIRVIEHADAVADAVAVERERCAAQAADWFTLPPTMRTKDALLNKIRSP